MALKFNLIAAADSNFGIGKKGNLPWKLRSEMEYFTRMTTNTTSKDKKNVVIMGRKTWDSIPPKFKPLNNRINFVLSRSDLKLSSYENTYSFKNLHSIIEALTSEAFSDVCERVWVVGGSYVYEETMSHDSFYRLYLTKIDANYDCDTFFPPLVENLEEVKDSEVPEGIQEENGTTFIYKIYQNTKFKQI